LDCCASTQGPELGLLLRLLRAVAGIFYRAVTLPYADTVASAVFMLTFLWVLVFQRGTPISIRESVPTQTVKRAA
jgi:hypothetical protein